MQQPVPRGLRVFRASRAAKKQRALIVDKEIKIHKKMEELRKVSHGKVTEDSLYKAAKVALGMK